MEQIVLQSDDRTLRSYLQGTWLYDLFDQSRSAYVRLSARLLNSNSMRCLLVRECTEETHYKGRTIETTVFSDALRSWHAQYTVWSTMVGPGGGNPRTTTTTAGISAYNEVDALSLAIEQIQELIDSQRI